jgi:hypothetical protein
MLNDPQRRIIIGILCLLMAAAALWLNVLDPDTGANYPQFQSGSLRMAAVLAVLWLALPEMKRGPGGILFLFAMLCAVVMVFSKGKHALKFLVPAITVLLVLGYLRKLTAAFGGRPRDEPRR